MLTRDASLPPATLRTGRLILRQWRAADFAPFAGSARIRRSWSFFRYANHRTERCIRRSLHGTIAGRDGDCGRPRRRASHPSSASSGWRWRGPGLPCSGEVEIGWRLDRGYWGCGYATEGASEALRFGFEELGLPEIVSFTAVINRRSEAVMQRLGMLRDPATFEHPRCPEGSSIRTHVLYRLSRDAWRGANRNN
jgi:RimJ/RimL family protein N-acetyltransferase